MATDGVSEVMDENGVELGDTDIFKKTLIAGAAKTPQAFVDDIVDLILKYNGDKKLHDDVTMMIAKVCGYELGDIVHTFGDTHIYLNHFEQVKTQLEREPRALPKMIIHGDQKDIFSFKYEDFELVDYDPHPTIKAPIAV